MMSHSRAKSFSFYHSETGLFHGSHFRTNCGDEAGCAAVVKLNTPPDHLAIEGHHDPVSKRVDLATSTVVDYQPPQPDADHEWNSETKRWQLNAATLERQQKRAAAASRIAQLAEPERHLMRCLMLNPADAAARAALAAIDAEVAELSKTIIPG